MSDTLDRNIQRLTEGSIVRALATLAVPIILTNALHTSHQLINTFWVGRLGADAVAAVSVSFPLIFLLLSLGGGLAIAGSILTAQYAGARDRAMVNHVSAQTLLMVIVVSLLFSVMGYFAVPSILRLMGIGADIFDITAHYMRVSFLGIVFIFGFAMFQSIMRGIGEVKAPLYVVAGSVALNLVLDPLFIYGWGPLPAGGVAGAAWATLISQGLAAAVGLRLLFGRRYGLHLRARDFVPDGALIRRVFMLGLPASIEQSMQALGITVMTVIVSSFGTLAIAAYGMGFRIFTFIVIPAFGISMATATLVGQSMGAGNRQRGEEIAVLSAWVAFILLSAAGVAVFFGAVPIVRFFVPADPALIEQGALVVRLMAISFGFVGAQMGLSGAFRGAGDTVATMVLAIVSIWVLQLPLAWLLAKHTSLGSTGLWLAYPLSSIVTTVASIVYFRRGRWKKIDVSSGARLRKKVTEGILIEEGPA